MCADMLNDKNNNGLIQPDSTMDWSWEHFNVRY